MREAIVKRDTKETQIELTVNLDGMGSFEGGSGIGFFDHMLNLLVYHGHLDLRLRCQGDLDVDGHHTVEDLGIALGMALRGALGDKRGIRRYTSLHLPMDEALALVALDISGRAHLTLRADWKAPMVGGFDTQLVEEFFTALTANAGITAHIHLLYGTNAHHCIEAVFKGFGRALREAAQVLDGEVPSSKGVL